MTGRYECYIDQTQHSKTRSKTWPPSDYPTIEILYIEIKVIIHEDGFGGLVVSMLASGTRVRGFKPGRSRWIFSVNKKIPSMPSFGGEVKKSVPCPNFAACKRT
jgi:hypothetical protein